MARDLKYLEERDYKVKEVQCVDMFGHSVHVEIVVLLERKYPDLRLGQLMTIVAKDKDLFSMEDYDLMDALYNMLDEEDRSRLWEDEEIEDET